MSGCLEWCETFKKSGLEVISFVCVCVCVEVKKNESENGLSYPGWNLVCQRRWYYFFIAMNLIGIGPILHI